MSQPWIKWTKGFARKPEIIRIAAKLGVSRHHAASIVMQVFEWLDDNVDSLNVCPEGHAEITLGAPPLPQLDALIDVPGLADAMSDAGWLQARSVSLVFPHFSRHNGSTAKARALDSARKSTERTLPAPRISPSEVCPNPVREKPDKNGTRLEEIRERELTKTRARGDDFLSIVGRHIATSMNLNPPELRPYKNEPQALEAKIAEWRKTPSVKIGDTEQPIDAVILRAAEKCEEAKLHGSRASNCLNWMDSVIDGCIRGGVWPGEYKASSASPMVEAAKPAVRYVPKELRK